MPVDSIGNNPATTAPRTPNPAEQIREQRIEATTDPAQRQLQEPQRAQEVVAEASDTQRADQQPSQPELRRPLENAGERREDSQEAAIQRQQRLDQAISNTREPVQARQQIDELA